MNVSKPISAVMAGITMAMLFPPLAIEGDSSNPATVTASKPKPTPPDKALTFFKQPALKQPALKHPGNKGARLEIRHALGTRKADLPEAVHATDAKTFPKLKPFDGPLKKGGPLPMWAQKFLASRGKP